MSEPLPDASLPGSVVARAAEQGLFDWKGIVTGAVLLLLTALLGAFLQWARSRRSTCVCGRCDQTVAIWFTTRVGDERWCFVCLGECDRYPKWWESKKRMLRYMEERSRKLRAEEAALPVVCAGCDASITWGQSYSRNVVTQVGNREMSRSARVCGECAEQPGILIAGSRRPASKEDPPSA
jgi:hypothetical protein